MTDISSFHIKTSRTARISVLGKVHSEIKHFWLVFHGYRQLAPRFLMKFHPAVDAHTLFVAPEALSRFYVDGYTGHVGASWMTREERLHEIADQIDYLNQVHAQFWNQIPKQAKLHVLGFSQGVATAWRWVLQSEIEVDSFTVWAGKIPEEYSEKMDENLNRVPMTFLCGDEDQFISPERGQVLINKMRLRYPNLAFIPFKGKHEVLKMPLLQLKDQILAN